MKIFRFLYFSLCVLLTLSACHPTGGIPPAPTPLPSVTAPVNLGAIDLGTWGKGSARDMTWSPDGKLLAVESTAGGYIYDASSWELLAAIPTESLEDNRLSNLTFFPDSQSLLFVSGSGTANVFDGVFWRYDLRTGVISRVFENKDIEEKSPYVTPVFSPDGKLFALHRALCNTTGTESICRDALQLYDASTGDLIRRIPENGLDQWEDMRVFAFSPDGQLIVAGGEDGAVRVWDVSSGTLRYTFQHESDVTSLSFSPDGRVLVSAGKDAAVRFWDLESGKSLYTLRGTLKEWFESAAFIEEGKRLLINYFDGKFKEYSLDEHFLPVAPLAVTMETEKRFASQMGRYMPELIMRFSPDGKTMALLVNSGVQIWNLQTGKRTLALSEFNREIFSMEFSPAGNLLALADHNVRLWQLSPKKFLGTLEVNGDQITDIAFRPDGARAAIAGTLADPQVWDLSARRRILTLKPDCPTAYLAYSPDGTKLAAAGECGIELFDAASGARLHKFPNDLGTPAGLSFSTDGNLLFYVSGNGRRAWDLTTGEQLYSTKRIDDYMGNVALQPGLLAVARNWHNTPIYFFEPASGKRLYELPGGEGSNALALSPDGRLLALDNYYRISLLDSTSGAELLSIRFPFSLFGMSFSQDNRLLAARSYENVVHLWDVSSLAQYADRAPRQTPTPNAGLTPTAQPTATPAPTLSLSVPAAPGPSSGDARAERFARMEKLGELGMGRVHTTAWSPDGKRLAVGGSPGVYIFQLGETQPISFLPADGDLLLLAFSPDGRYLAGQISNYAMMIWDVEKGSRLQKFEHIYCWNWETKFSPDSELLTADCGNEIYTWQVSSGLLVKKETKDTTDPSSSERYTVQTGMESARLVDTQSGEILRTFKIPGMAPALSIFSPDRRTLAVWHYQYEIARTGVYFPGQDYKTVLQLWNILPDQPPTLRAELATGKWLQQTFILGAYQGISFSPDSRRLATASGDGITQIWDVRSGQLLSTLPDGNNLYFSPDGRRIASLGENGARVWDVSSRQPKIVWEISGFNRYSFSLAFAKGGDELVSATEAAYKFFDLSDPALLSPSRQLDLPGVRGHNLSISPDGSRLAYSTAEEILIGENHPQDPNWKILSKFSEPLTYDRDLDLTFSPDGSLLASYDPDNKIRLWDLRNFTSRELASNLFVSKFLFSPDGTLLLGTDPHTAEPSIFYLWDTRTGKLVRQWTIQAYQFVFHPHQPVLIGADYMTGIVRFFDLRTGDLVKEIRADQHVLDITISPDGSLLALGYDNKFEIRAAETLTLLKELPYGSDLLVFSPDGKRLVAGLNDGRIQIWGLPEK